ncbi:MAG: 6-carboxytetrahydropterin synthase [Acidobacteriaceae bacterium]|nr:6-carboxytetrahydropterin synthase [Acidobacteriaceae bacterium]
MTTLTRIYRFSASHRLHSPELSRAENQALYGKCNNPFGHGHDYVLEVTVTGEVDEYSGLILPRLQLDRLVEEQILSLFASRNINLDVPQFSTLVPTTENIAIVITNLLEEHWGIYVPGTRTHLFRVRLQETDRNACEIRISAADRNSASGRAAERLFIHA